ncbi:MAG: methyl-accepting chemotaxis protein [Gemmatimonadota bacterium]|nr:MAG: methyl-accepting chemotaxis protein [Gemmatimonadota bacterium]
MPIRITDLRRRVILVATPIAIAVIAAGGYLAARVTAGEFERAARLQLELVAQRTSVLIDQYLSERASDVRILAQMEVITEAASAAGEETLRLGLEFSSTDELEQRYADQPTLGGDELAGRVLAAFRDSSDFAEVLFTERHGLIVWSTDRASDVVQSDEEWWSTALETGWFQGQPAHDESAGRVGLELAARLDAQPSGEPVGALKAVLDLSRFARWLTAETTAAVTIEAIDSAGRVILSNDSTRLLVLADYAPSVPRTGESSVVSRAGAAGRELIGSGPTNEDRWWVVVRQPQETALAGARSIRETIYVGAGLALLLAVLLLAWFTEWLHRRVTKPVQVAGAVAQRVADGDLSLGVTTGAVGTQEVKRLLGSVQKMVAALRQLVGEMRTSSQESAAMAEQISAATEEMSASTQEMANTCQDLSSQATEQAELARQSADDAARILGISTTLADGANVAAERSTVLADTASEHRERLIEGSQQLARLASDLERGAADAERLASLSQEIQQFLTQSKAIATQTNMLALNAAIEASRAGGGEGRGFAVVADEVRKLANQAARSAATTSDVVRSVLNTVRETQNRLANLAQASTAVRQVAESAAGALEEVTGATAESSAWSDEISRAAGEVNKLVEDITQRLHAIAQGTESVVAASEQIAASAEQQSASTEQIAASASQLADAADRLTMTVGSFRLAGGDATGASAGKRPTEEPAA